MPDKVPVEIDGRIIAVSNLDKVLYPAVGFTKAQVIDYYVRIAATMLPHVAGRGITLRRWPDGVDADSFFEKRCPSHRPDWLSTVEGPGDRGGAINYCCLDEPASLDWTASAKATKRDTSPSSSLVFSRGKMSAGSVESIQARRSS